MYKRQKLDRTKGLDLILHTPGGEIAAAESIVDYIRRMFGTDVRAIVPQIAMSAGTMIACSCKCIIMGKESNLGPIDPQFGGIPASGVIEEFKTACEETAKHPEYIPMWSIVISKYHPTFIGECEKAIEWSQQMVKGWLMSNMFADDAFPEENALKVVEHFGSHEETKAHNRHINIDECERTGLKIEHLETIHQEKNFQDIVLSTHHAYMHTFSNSTSVKIIENQNGIAMVQHYNGQ